MLYFFIMFTPALGAIRRAWAGSPWPRSGRSAPEPAAGDPRALDQRAQLRPGDLGVNLVAGARRAEAAIGAGDHPFAPDHAGEALDALRDQLRMLDQMDAVRHHAGIRILSSGSFTSCQTCHSCSCRGLAASIT